MPHQLERGQHRNTRQQNAGIPEASGEAGGAEKEQDIRVADIGNRQGTQGGDHAQVGGTEQPAAPCQRPAGARELRIEIEVCDRHQSGAIADGQGHIRERNHGGGHAENRHPEHQGKDEVAAQQGRQGGLPVAQLGYGAQPDPAHRLLPGVRGSVPIRGDPAEAGSLGSGRFEPRQLALAQGLGVHRSQSVARTLRFRPRPGHKLWHPSGETLQIV